MNNFEELLLPEDEVGSDAPMTNGKSNEEPRPSNLQHFESQLNELKNTRKSIKEKKISRLMNIGFFLTALGVIGPFILFCLGYFSVEGINKSTNISENPFIICGLIMGAVASIGYLFITVSLSNSEMDFKSNQNFRRIGWIGFCCFVALFPPYFGVISIPVAVLLFYNDTDSPPPLSGAKRFQYNLPTYKVSLIYILWHLSIGFFLVYLVICNTIEEAEVAYLFSFRGMFPTGIAASTSILIAVFFTTVSFFICIFSYLKRHRKYLMTKENGFNPTLLLIFTAHVFFAHWGAIIIALGVIQVYYDDYFYIDDPYYYKSGIITGSTWLVVGIEVAFSPCLAMIVSPKLLFLLFSRLVGDSAEDERFKSKASLLISRSLSSFEVAIGDPFWVHYGGETNLPERRIPVSDDIIWDDRLESRKKWYKGKISSIGPNWLDVELDIVPETKVLENAPIRVHHKFPDSETGIYCMNRQLSQDLNNSDFSQSYVDWSMIKSLGVDVFEKSPRVQSDLVNERKSIQIETSELKKGEKIDYFISHSWNDDPKWKYEKLCDVAETFKSKHHRYPTFWLDKACINQDDIDEGLQNLAVNLMACKKMLVLVGNTYPKKIWCAWELFVMLLLMSSTEEAISHMEIYSKGSNKIRSLMEFKVEEAWAYNPNEETKLRNIISHFKGEDDFKERLFNLAILMIKKAV